MILLIDNYDSFVYNLARYFTELGCETLVVRNDRATFREVREMGAQAIVLSPGPCTPAEGGISLDVVRELGSTVPMLGVCLGHQTIAAAFGTAIIRAPLPVHGQTSLIRHAGEGLFQGLPNPMRATRYHSLIVDEGSLPDEFAITARTDDSLPMALQHRNWPLYGVQFHPESILTQDGHRLLANFLHLAGIPANTATTGERTEPTLPPRDAEPSLDEYGTPPLPHINRG